jgi:hypothetical protein
MWENRRGHLIPEFRDGSIHSPPLPPLDNSRAQSGSPAHLPAAISDALGLQSETGRLAPSPCFGTRQPTTAQQAGPAQPEQSQCQRSMAQGLTNQGPRITMARWRPQVEGEARHPAMEFFQSDQERGYFSLRLCKQPKCRFRHLPRYFFGPPKGEVFWGPNR